MPVSLKRAHIVRQGVDVTRKSAKGRAMVFAPTWNMVLGHKDKILSDAEYIEAYHTILQSIPKTEWQWLAEQEKDGVVAVKCYCSPDKPFCHTEFLITWACEHHPELFERFTEDVE